jgi:hypothetical protein
LSDSHIDATISSATRVAASIIVQDCKLVG